MIRSSIVPGKHNSICKRLLGELTVSTRLPRECGDPGKRRFHEVVNNITSIGIDPFGGIICPLDPRIREEDVWSGVFRQTDSLKHASINKKSF